MTWLELRKMLDPKLARQFRTKKEFKEWAGTVDQKTRVGGHGTGRMTVKRALTFLD